MKKLLALIVSLAVCCTMFAAYSDIDRSSSPAESSSIADTTTADNSAADTTTADSSSAADSSDTSSEANTSSADEPTAPTVPSFTEIRENEKAAETVDFDPAPFDLLDELAHSEHHTFSYTQKYAAEDNTVDSDITDTYTEVLDGENAYASMISDSAERSSKQAYLLLDGRSYFIDYDNKAYFEEKEAKTVQQVIYAFSRDLESHSDWLNEGYSSAVVCKATLFGKDCLKYSFVLGEENITLYAKDGVPTYITDSYTDDEEDNAAITYNRLEATADQDLLKLPDGFKQLTQDEYYDLYGQYD